jgi:hypothetical protein
VVLFDIHQTLYFKSSQVVYQCREKRW